MTIYTGKSLEKEDDKIPDPLVVTEPLLLTAVPIEDEHEHRDNVANEEVAGPPIVVTVMSRRKRGACANACMLLTALVVLATCILAGVYLYKSLSHRTFQGWCSVPYFEKEELEDMRQRAEAIYSQTGHYRRRYGKFEEHVEIDKLDGMYECIEVPEFEDSEPATVVHDFEKNVTAIVDKTRFTCFIMPLNRTIIMPPRDHWDLLSKLMSGYYMPNVEVVRERYRVIHPKLRDLSSHGYYIWRQCYLMDTYMLERIGAHDPIAMAKRSVRHVDEAAYPLQFAVAGGLKYLPIAKIEGF